MDHDDTFDDLSLSVPDNWLDIGSKRKSENDDDSTPSSPKRSKLEDKSSDDEKTEQSFAVNNLENSHPLSAKYHIGDVNLSFHESLENTLENLLNGSKQSLQQVLDQVESLDSESSEANEGTLEDGNVNEPDFDDDDDEHFITVSATPAQQVGANYSEKNGQPCSSDESPGPSRDPSCTESVPTAEEPEKVLKRIDKPSDTLLMTEDVNMNESDFHKDEQCFTTVNNIIQQDVENNADGNRSDQSGSDKDSHTRTDPPCAKSVATADAVLKEENKSATEDEERCDSESNSSAAQIVGSNGEIATVEPKSDLRKLTSVVRDAKIISNIVPNKDFNEIYDLLLDHRDREDRLDYVTFQLVSSAGDSSTDSSTEVILQEVQQVISAMPGADANEVYTVLESLPSKPNRVKTVISKLKKAGSTVQPQNNIPVLQKKSSSITDDPLLKNDPLFRDMRTIAKMFPDKDRNEIYALLEANFAKESRLQTVINELLQAETNGQEKADSLDTVTIKSDVSSMMDIFPDCDPNYLYNKLESMKEKANRKDLLAAEMFDKRDYPKLKDLEAKSKVKETKEKRKHMTFTIEEFLQKFPDPVKTFCTDWSAEPTESYKKHAFISLKNEFPVLKTGYIKNVMAKYNSHYLPAYREINDNVSNPPGQRQREKGRYLKNPRTRDDEMPEEINEYFYHEHWLSRNMEAVVAYPWQKKKERKQKIEEARAKGELYECCCCYEDECLFEDLASCPEGHLFCKTCVQRSTEAAFGEMKTKFPCLTGECDQDIPLSILQPIISANLFSKIVRRMQEEEVLQADIPDLVTCPFCPFATIMPNPDDKVLKCLNPECLKESCRLCREASHIPLRCNEVEKQAETTMRTYIENKISEAVMRKCSNCGKHFVKDMGCNKMTCICGTTSCYACKEQNIDYDHFNRNKKCSEADPDKIHQRDMEEAAIKAKNQYLLDHPEAADIDLKTDVKDMIEDYRKMTGIRAQPGQFRYDYDDEYEDSDAYDSENYDDSTEEGEEEDEDDEFPIYF